MSRIGLRTRLILLGLLAVRGRGSGRDGVGGTATAVGQLHGAGDTGLLRRGGAAGKRLGKN